MAVVRAALGEEAFATAWSNSGAHLFVKLLQEADVEVKYEDALRTATELIKSR